MSGQKRDLSGQIHGWVYILSGCFELSLTFCGEKGGKIEINIHNCIDFEASCTIKV